MPAVTVILPCYNGANYLRESIDSILAQTWTDFQLHILDDCSTDESAQIAKSYSDPRVRYSRNPEKFGLFKTLNRGCQEAESDWVRIWAHDDRMLPEGLAKHMLFVQKHPEVGMAYCQFYEMDSNSKRTERDNIFQAMWDRTPDIMNSRLSAFLFFVYGCMPGNISTVMLNRMVWDNVGGFLVGIQQSPDYEMWVRISEKYPIGFIREKLIELREHPMQLGRMGTKLLTSIDEEILVIDQLKKRLRNIITESAFRKYWCHHRGRQQIHWLARAIARGDIYLAMKGWNGVAKYGNRMGSVAHWLISANGRWATVDAHSFHDQLVKLFI